MPHRKEYPVTGLEGQRTQVRRGEALQCVVGFGRQPNRERFRA